MLSRLAVTLLLRSKRLLISWLHSPSAVILEPQKIKSDTVSPSISHEVMGPDAMILVFWMLSFKPTFSPSSSTSIRRLFSSCSLSAIRVVSSAYLRLLIFLPAILTPKICLGSKYSVLVIVWKISSAHISWRESVSLRNSTTLWLFVYHSKAMKYCLVHISTRFCTSSWGWYISLAWHNYGT